MGTSTRRRLRDGLISLSALALAGASVPVAASAAPTPSPNPSPRSSATSSPGAGGDAPAASPHPVPQTRTSYSTSASPFALTVSPARLTVGPDALGDVQQVTVVNQGREPVTVDVQKRNFTAGPDGGLTYRPDAPYGAADWVDVSPTSLTIDPGTSRQVSARFSVPSQPEPGDHQVALIFMAPPGADGNIRVSRGIGTPVYITVPGPTDDSVRLDGLTGPSWSLRGHPTLTASLTSTGTVHRDFRGPSALSVGTPGHLSRFSDFTVSRGSDRQVSTTWEPPLFCVCHPSLSVTNAGQATQSVSTRVIVAPWWSLVALLLVVGGLVLLLRWRRRLRRPGAVPEGASAVVTDESG